MTDKSNPKQIAVNALAAEDGIPPDTLCMETSVLAGLVDTVFHALRRAGLTIVPRKPTEAMVIAAAKAFHTSSVGDGFEPVITAAIEAGEQGGEDG